MQQWPPVAEEKSTCENCGSHVSEAFRRCYGENGRVYACIDCSFNHELEETAGGRR